MFKKPQDIVTIMDLSGRHAEAAATALEPLRMKVLRWASQTKRRTEAAAALRDAIALADMAPTLSPGIRQHLGA
eukprot:5892381-Pyramimonas_sp.AAC.1